MRLFEGTSFDRPPQCERCGKLEAECQCPPPSEIRTPPGKQRPRIGLERRKAKRLVTTIRDLADEGDHLPALLTKLKNVCGAGGAVQDGVLELQGDQQQRVREALTKLGYRPQ